MQQDNQCACATPCFGSVERHRKASTAITGNRETPEVLTMTADPPPAQSAMDRLQRFMQFRRLNRQVRTDRFRHTFD
ncbi:hypothetical protein [Nocardia gipuzkoensis]|uniref:hypothetical protein n=1 Tax=Nocardia gipuzkoensis TaxID=2749991 RepID=UPI003CC804E5